MTSQLKTLLLLALLSGIIIAVGGAIGGSQGLVIALVIALFMNAGSYWFSDKIVLGMYKAGELAEADAPLLHRMVEDLSARAGIPKPRIYLVPDESPNAFATGRNPEHAVVAVTDGIMRLLSPEELRGVLAHEIAHIAHRDILIQSVAAVLASVITFLAHMAQFAAIFGGRGSDERGGGNPIAMLLMAILAPLAAALIQFAISRSREYLADQGGAEYSGRPQDLASALGKLQSYSQRVPMREQSEATAHMFIVNPLSGKSLAGLFSTHPPIGERIKRLMAMRK
ncbi:MAG: zinc metalloprotease HtpX [Deltaproteobacteria bacterium]|jgi:heat shock protein HtpX|nr:zinc metalloprotease HtpX [Deltaproteobacteria bacterium]